MQLPWLPNRRFSPAPISWRRQFNLPPMLRLCRRPQRTRRAATNWLPRLNPPVGINRKVVRHHLKPCLGNSKRGRLRKMRRHRSSPYNSPFKMLRQRLREMPEHHSGRRKSNRTFGRSIMHEQRTNLRKPRSWEYWVCAIRRRLASRRLRGQPRLLRPCAFDATQKNGPGAHH